MTTTSRSGGSAGRARSASGIVHPGEVGELDRKLHAGRYALWCTLGDHRAQGMRAMLAVR